MNQASPVKVYLLIWLWLAGLMLLGVFLSEANILPWPRATIIAVIVMLSTIKAALVALYYMHLKLDRRVLAFIALTPFVLISIALCVIYSSKLIRL